MIGSKVIAAVSKSTGISASSLNEITRSLRSDGSDLWPASQKGGGRNAPHMESRHAAALLIALGRGSVRNAADAVREIIALKSELPKVQGYDPSEGRYPWIDAQIPGFDKGLVKAGVAENCLDAVARVIESLAEDDVFASYSADQQKIYEDRKLPEMEMHFGHNQVAGHRVWLIARNRRQKRSAPEWSQPFGFRTPLSGTEILRRAELYPNAVLESRHIGLSFLLLLASFWRDTLRSRKKDPASSVSSSAPGSADRPKEENPAPGRAGLSKVPTDPDCAEHSKTYPNPLGSGFKGRSMGWESASAEREGRSGSPQPRSFHVRDHAQLELA